MQLEEQNSESSLRMLAAQRQLYSEAKSVGKIRTYSALLTFLLAYLYLCFYPGIRNIVAITGAFAWVAALILKHIESRKAKMAATIQEEFDTNLFKLAWNDILVGPKISKELIMNANRRFKGDRGILTNWYPDKSTVDSQIEVLACQRANLVWDWRLRQGYTLFLAIIITLLLIGEMAVAFNIRLQNYLLGVLIPSLPLILLEIERAILHYSSAREKRRLEQTINRLLENKNCTTETGRAIQDKIYILRTNTALVPDWFYYLFRNSFESDMRQATDELHNERENREHINK